MAEPTYKSYSVDDVNQGSATVTVPVPAEADTGALPSATDWQGACIMSASSGADIDPASLDGTGWIHRQTIFPRSPDTGASGTSAFIFLELDPDATLEQRQADLTCSLTSSRVWTAVRVCVTLPTGSTGRTIPWAQLAESIDGPVFGGTTHNLPPITTTEPDSLVVGFGGSDQWREISTAQSFNSFGDWTGIVTHTGPNTSERICVGAAYKTAPTPGTVEGTWTTQSPDECGFFVVALNGVGGSSPTGDPARFLLSYA